MPQLAESLITPADYLARERRSEVRSEYLNGRVYAMSGASREHNRITINLSAMLHSRLKGKPCEPFSGDLRVKVSPTGLYTYPDVIVACGESRFEDEHVDTLLDPTVIIEVLSDSTEAYDRGEKFAHYRALESLTDYLLVAQDRPRIEHFVRQPDSRWLYSVTDGLDEQVEIATLDCVLPLAEVYERVVFSE